MGNNVFTVNTIAMEDNMKYNGETILTYKIEYPEFESSGYQMSLTVINQYYKKKALEYKYYFENDLFNMAVEQYKDDIQNNYPVRVFEALVVYKLTYNKGCIVSLYFDQYQFTGGAHGNTLRYSQTWNVQRCSMIRLSQLFICETDYKANMLRQARDEMEKDPSIYFEDSEKLLVEYFNKDSFYCTSSGIVVYYQQYEIAPYSSGIREFLIPYSMCVIDPIKKCVETK